MADTNQERLSKFATEAEEALRENLTMALSRLGEKCISRIRRKSHTESWYDRTGNLRSSIGMAVYEKNQIVTKSSFENVQGPDGNHGEGSSSGEAYVRQVASEVGNGFSLAVVAGMNYASYVEDMENKDVLASTEIWAREEAKDLLERAVEQTIESLNDKD